MNLAVEDAQISNYHGEFGVVLYQIVRVEHRNAFRAAKVEIAEAVFEGGVTIEVAASQTVFTAKSSDIPALAINARQATGGGEPNGTRVVLDDAGDVGGGQAIADIQIGEGSCVRVPNIYPSMLCAHPDSAAAVFEQRAHVGAADGVGRSGARRYMAKL